MPNGISFFGGLLSGYRIKKIAIGDWNIDTTPTVSIPHGLNPINIATVWATVYDDSGLWRVPLPSTDSADVAGNYSPYVLAGNVVLIRPTGGFLDNPGWDLTPYNRGFVFILHDT